MYITLLNIMIAIMTSAFNKTSKVGTCMRQLYSSSLTFSYHPSRCCCMPSSHGCALTCGRRLVENPAHSCFA
jgi:hypothetical protein